MRTICYLLLAVVMCGSVVGESLASEISDHSEKRSLTEVEAQDLVKNSGMHLLLNGLEDLTPSVAVALSAHDGSLYLNGLNELTPEVADALSRHYGLLEMNGVESLSDNAANCLGQHLGGPHGGLLLNGIET